MSEPVRKTPWREIAWQIGGAKSFAVIEQHEREFIEPKGDALSANRSSIVNMVRQERH